MAKHPQVRLLHNPRRTIPHALNVGRRAARGTFVARVDAHEVHTGGFTAVETASITGHRWWPRPELASTAEQVFPADLAQVLARVLAA